MAGKKGKTKEKILDAALEAFASSGYEATSMREIAGKLGFGKSALYKHYESKEDIWNALLDEMEAYYGERFGSADNLPPTPKSLDELEALSLRMLDFTIHDERIVLTRRLLLTEQFRNERAAALAADHFLTTTENIFTTIFQNMMDAGLLRRDDPAMLAFAFTAPISALILQCDREPQMEPELIERARAFIRHFIETYGVSAR